MNRFAERCRDGGTVMPARDDVHRLEGKLPRRMVNGGFGRLPDRRMLDVAHDADDPEWYGPEEVGAERPDVPRLRDDSPAYRVAAGEHPPCKSLVHHDDRLGGVRIRSAEQSPRGEWHSECFEVPGCHAHVLRKGVIERGYSSSFDAERQARGPRRVQRQCGRGTDRLDAGLSAALREADA